MKFSDIKKQLNNEEAIAIIDSVLNAGELASFVIDRSTFEIIYHNNKAGDILGDSIDKLCHDVISACDRPCMDCPMTKLSGTTLECKRYTNLLEQVSRWQYTKIKWFDGRDAVLVTLLEIGDSSNAGAKNIAKQIEQGYVTDRRELDSLTNIPNITRFYANVENALKYNPDKNYSIVIFDIDHFKSINDLYGMAQGDEVLRGIADSLREMFYEEQSYARIHSDKFAFYMPYTKRGEIIKTIEKLRKRLNNRGFEFDINTSFGIYLVSDRDVPVNLMCDRAMMASKTIKDNIMRFCAFYDEQYRDDMLKASEIERDMNKALENGEFVMYLQPKYKLSDGTLCGAEVLCRWIHPEKGIIPPIDFIPLFEKNGFILKLDEYMWEEACKAIRQWLDEGRKPVPLSVNISRYHIKHNDLVGTFTRLLKKYNLQPDLLTLEITESLFLDNPQQLNRVLIRLKDMGFKLEVDDFGSGFSSLNLIRNISVDTIKIDKEFLDNEIATKKGKIVVNHTISMAKDLQLQVIAEGVETEEHVEFLKNSKCDIAQGFFFARPMPVEEFNKLEF